MPKVSTRKRLKHKKTHGMGRKKSADSENSSGVPSESDAQEAYSANCPPQHSPSPVPSHSSVASSSRPSSALSVAESENLDFLEDNNLSSPDPSVVSISPVASLASNDPLDSCSSAGSPFHFQPISSPESPSNARASDILPGLGTPFKVPTTDMVEPSPPKSSPVKKTHSESLLRIVKDRLELFLRSHWMSLVHDDSLFILYLSRNEDKITQRQVIAKADGTIKLKVHCKTLSIEKYVKDLLPARHLHVNTVGYFVDRLVYVLNTFSSFEVCAGVPNVEYKCVWEECKSGVIDRNPYKESRYHETFRSVHCDTLVSLRQWKCVECGRLTEVLKRKSNMAGKDECHRNTPNMYLSESQRLQKLGDLKKKVDVSNKKFKRLQEKMNHLLQQEGVEIDEDDANDFKKALESQDLSETQSLFLQQQMKAIKAKSPRGFTTYERNGVIKPLCVASERLYRN
ncbi:S-layer protein [Frankliniella fusca]|uniref:S-layer protein n=1 Tax=Frankliniella fusca TaxID=407009 RepID=A0AAE1HZH2_9NEOP|nr:S-layer protein [Frankliniella fusca]